MFCVGMNRTLDMYFAAASLLVSIPTGIKFFNWLATMYGGRISLASPMLFSCGFLSMFVLGGLTGIMLACAPFDFQVSRYLFRRRPFPLGADRRHPLRRLLGHHVLVSQSHWSHAFGTFGEVAVLAAPHRLHSHVRSHARFRNVGYAAPHLHVLARPAVAILEPTQHHRRANSGAKLLCSSSSTFFGL